MSAAVLIDAILKQHHAYLKSELPLIAALIRDYASRMTEFSAWEGLAAAFQDLQNELMHHLSKEEAMLFPAICHIEESLAAGEKPDLTRFDIRESLGQAENEHDQSEDCMQSLLRFAAMLEAEGKCLDLVARIKALRDDLEVHVRKEENELFPQARFLYAKATEGTLREE